MSNKESEGAFINRLAQIAKESSSEQERTYFGDPLPADAMIEAAANRELTPGHIALRGSAELENYDPPL